MDTAAWQDPEAFLWPLSFISGRISSFFQLQHGRKKVGKRDVWAFSTGMSITLAKKNVEDGFDFGKAS